ncbi:CHASE2 domain-containing sensor protein [Hoyosella altamirensis]|uniref:CHASE2 domain-containing sensor protein n=1 Tax=Hoyosella altamirensis TaxID=616997 RepID=A0A839RN42_9ACTN|nr:CHASE2 domain-containing sensor protein [Hoyosella altamirensis]
MSAVRRARRPWPELAIFITGFAGVLSAMLFKSEILLVGSIFACLFAVLSAIFSVFLSPRKELVVHAIAILLGVAGTIYGTYWYLENKGGTQILFSPVFFAYLGGGLVLAGIFNLSYRLRNK